VHVHGLGTERDHQPLSAADIPFLQRLAQEMVEYDYGNVVTLELYKVEDLARSLELVHRAWQSYAEILSGSV
jgi:hypothetical protein